ncbi:hypothetical protein [Paraburkholderia solisilvae]|nr:hypothetical protein [Paraburkholderia solisilvae]
MEEPVALLLHDIAHWVEDHARDLPAFIEALEPGEVVVTGGF